MSLYSHCTACGADLFRRSESAPWSHASGQNTHAPVPFRPALHALGDVLGPLRHLGACSRCRTQFMSTHERVALVDGATVCCERCAGAS